MGWLLHAMVMRYVLATPMVIARALLVVAAHGTCGHARSVVGRPFQPLGAAFLDAIATLTNQTLWWIFQLHVQRRQRLLHAMVIRCALGTPMVIVLAPVVVGARGTCGRALNAVGSPAQPLGAVFQDVIAILTKL